MRRFSSVLSVQRALEYDSSPASSPYCCQNYGTFVPRKFRSLELLFPGTFVPWNFRPKSEIYMELSFPNSKIIILYKFLYPLRRRRNLIVYLLRRRPTLMI